MSSTYDGIVNRYIERTKKSRELHAEAKRLLPRGVSSNFRVVDPNPIFIESAIGATITDADGNRYTDFANAFGAMLVGHAHPTIVKAIEAQAKRGTLHAMPHRLEVSVAKELKERFGQDQWRFANSGTEATMHAIRLARGYTGRPKVLKFEGGYHGAHDTVLVSNKPPLRLAGLRTRPRVVPWSDGIPEESYAHTLVATFNDLKGVRALLEEHPNEVACVILEPIMMNMGVTEPLPDFLPGLRALCTELGVLLVFDEVKTGVKIARGGATEYFKVKPDITVLAKAIGGGMPLAAFGASAEIMEELNSLRVIHVGTYASNPITLAAAEATLKEVLTDEAYRRVFGLNKKLVDGYSALIREHNLPCYANGVGSMGTINFRKDVMRDYRDWAAVDRVASQAWYLAMLNEGVIPQPPGPDEQWTISVQHTEADIETHLKAFARVAPLLKSL
ncbi:MAG TPA: aspartate aminotransferase family protein [Candidatus Polarisedimenticolia bacterium]|nr:aspartate aminotransferase family protein [Candidatus Polarisedimenticolia bacterium]